ncbi:methyl-accepting chemotaxis protein [Ramlibacter sp.]|uniref:methyl-accepting chemotaxis protein n=1 Tax=Ramlibacter sp. TaxID=1917967 RepID=UPI002FC78FA9
MQGYLNLPTRTKLFIAFTLTSLCAAAAIVFAYLALSAMRQSQRDLVDVEMATVVDLKDIRAEQNAINASMALLMVASKDVRKEHLQDRIAAKSREVGAELQRVAARKGSIEGKRNLLREFDAIREASIQLRERQILPLLDQGRTDEARELFTGVQLPRDQQMGALVNQLIAHATRSAAEAVAESERQATNAMRWLVVIAAMAMLGGLALTVLLTRMLAGPLRELSEAAERIAAGDLTVELRTLPRKDEMGVLSRTFAQMVERLRQMMREISDGVGVLGSSASEISASTAQVSASSAQTASAVAETSATAEEVKQTAQVASDKAAHVQGAAQRSVEASQAGLRAMEESIQAMQQIRQQMDSMAGSVIRLADQGTAIGEIIATVSDLADQSNLLSVNAAIEAARAGEEGSGFRVVAQEIRSLAEQSKQATVQVRALLGDIQKATSAAVLDMEQAGKAVSSGVELSEKAARSIRSTTDTIVESAQDAALIAASAQQQAIGMDQVAYAMQNINQASAQNVAASRQSEAAAHELKNLGLRLKGVVEQFRV